jgi:subtilisin family serine protease
MFCNLSARLRLEKVKSLEMKKMKPRRTAAWLTAVSLMLSLCSGILVAGKANARTVRVSATTTKANYPKLSLYAQDLTAQSREASFAQGGHKAEIKRVIELLSGDSQQSPVLISEVSLTSFDIIRGVARKIDRGDVPESLQHKRIFALNLESLAANAKSDSEFTNRLHEVLTEVESAQSDVLLFVDQLHQFVGSYAAKAASDSFRTALQQGRIRLVGATTAEAYQQYIGSEVEVANLFKEVRVRDAAEKDGENSGNDEENAAENDGFTGERISPDLRAMIDSGQKPSDRVSVILQGKDLQNGQLTTMLKRKGILVTGMFRSLDAIKVEAPLSAIEALTANSNTRYVSLDRQVQSMGHLTATTGADLARTQTTTSGFITTTTTFDGAGIGIAILDSGIDTGHVAFLGKTGSSRIVFSKDFTGENRIDDPYGHGTHVAAIAAGNGRIGNGAYRGVAPEARIVNLRVLNATGTGTVSGILAALDWLAVNAATHNVRVVNLSLGTPAVDSYKNDPICRAVRKLVDAGMVVLAAAGNNGKNSFGQKVYGQIHCPGNEPSALTVGASNTLGTNSRHDDTVASFSSRGPTRSYTVVNGVKKYDNLIKPDIVAPGNKINSAQSDNNLLVTQNPLLHLGVSSLANRKQMRMSGSSMATPAAAGAAVMMLHANPKLTPNMVKAIMMYTAQSLNGFNMFEQGAGQLNIEGSMRLAKLVRDFGNTKPIGSSFLTSSMPNPQTTVSGRSFTWSQGLVLGRKWARGVGLMTRYQPVYAKGVLLSDGVIVSDGVIASDGVVVSDGVSITSNLVLGNGVIISDGVVVSDGVIVSDGTTLGVGSLFLNLGVIVGDGVIVSDGYALADGVLVGDGVIVGDGVLVGDSIAVAQSAQVGGDLVTAIELVLDSGLDSLEF